MLGGLEGYGSDDSDSESPQQLSKTQPTSSLSKSSFVLPPPTSAAKTPSLPPKVKSRRPVFTITKPSKASGDDDDQSEERAAKKPRLESRKGAGSSSLLAMLPAPTKAPPIPAAPPRVLGSAAQGGGGTGVILRPSTDESPSGEEFYDFRARNADDTQTKSTALVPPSLAKGRIKVPAPSKETCSPPRAPTVDFFSLGSTASRLTPAAANNLASDFSESSTSTSVTSAPTVPTFEPPPPTPSDPYPGYYQLPKGQWAAYDPEFYKKHYDLWLASRGLDGNSQKGFEGAEGDNTVEVDAQEQLDRARQEREEKKALTVNAGGGPAAPKMNIKAPKMGSRARTRHQLSALLTEAYENREALEEQIAQGRRNRKEAGNKYGF